ncbi:MAG: hypothetical protein OEV61_03835 [Chloroflexota bacterium]|jgi:hypothetical protein|nr:hypothetical protein [Chloroflexota bacterium]MDH5242519.1 hypothetical protein [Chloroflexota bacterium]
MGDIVNTAAPVVRRGQGELLWELRAATSAGLSNDRYERRSLDLKGRSTPTEVLVLEVFGDTG